MGALQLPGMGPLAKVQREKTYGGSCFDFYVEDKDGQGGWLEVKGVTLEEGGTARFPRRAYGARGVKHVQRSWPRPCLRDTGPTPCSSYR